MKTNSIEKDLSEGNLLKNLILFSLPFLLSNVIQSLYSIADMLIVGNYAGTASMSGVNIGGQLTFIFTNIIIGFCVGGTVLIAQYLGSKNREAMQKTVSTLITSLIAVAVVMTAFMLIFRNPLLKMIQTPTEAYSEAKSYLTVTSLGIIFIFGYNALSGILRGMGDSKRPLYFVCVACVVNVVFDLLLVGKFGMGANGAAIATVFSQALSMVLCIIYLRRHDFIFDFKLSSFKIDKGMLGRIAKIGAPTAVQNGITSVSFLFITALVNIVGGVTASAAVGVVGKFNGFAIMPAAALSGSISTMAAQNIGAGKWDRAKKTAYIGTGIAIVIGTAIFVLTRFIPAEIIALFGNDPKMIEDGVIYLRAFAYDYFLVPVVFCYNGLFIASGHTTFSLVNNMLSAVIVRIPACLLLGVTLGMGLEGIAYGVPIASMASVILIVWFYYSGKWMKNKVEELEDY